MATVGFSDLGDDARLWVYGFGRALGPADLAHLQPALDAFVVGWESHRQPVRGAWMVSEGWFVVLAGEVAGGVSGCSTDASVRVLKGLRETHGLDALDAGWVYFHDGASVRAARRDEFQRLLDTGAVGAATLVYDLTLTLLGEWRAGRCRRPLAHAWHARAFTLPAAAAGA